MARTLAGGRSPPHYFRQKQEPTFHPGTTFSYKFPFGIGSLFARWPFCRGGPMTRILSTIDLSNHSRLLGITSCSWILDNWNLPLPPADYGILLFRRTYLCISVYICNICLRLSVSLLLVCLFLMSAGARRGTYRQLMVISKSKASCCCAAVPEQSQRLCNCQLASCCSAKCALAQLSTITHNRRVWKTIM